MIKNNLKMKLLKLLITLIIKSENKKLIIHLL